MNQDTESSLIESQKLSEPMTKEQKRLKLEEQLYTKGTRIKSFILLFLLGNHDTMPLLVVLQKRTKDHNQYTYFLQSREI